MGKRKSIDDDAISSLAASIISTVRSSANGKAMELKALRTLVLAATPGLAVEVDKTPKKLFKQAVKSLEKDKRISLNAQGIVKLSKLERAKQKSLSGGGEEEKVPKSEKRGEKNQQNKDEKRKRQDGVAGSDREDDEKRTKKRKTKNKQQNQESEERMRDNTIICETQQCKDDENGDGDGDDTDKNIDLTDKNKPCKGNPQGVTRLFLGNLPFAIDKPTLDTHFQNCITHVKWITDKETGRFYGSAFCEVRTSRDAARCMAEINGSDLLGRPIKINYAPVRSGEEGDWPPRSSVITGGKVANAGGKGQAGGSGIKAMSVKPEGCCKLFIGNLSYDIDDEGITKFFQGVDAEIKSVRWLHHQDSGDFKGCGFVDFWNTEACEKAAVLNGKNLLGRPIRIDWTD